VRHSQPNRSPVNVGSIIDGTTNTMLAGERGLAIQWYQFPGGPENDVFRGGFVAGMVANGGYLTGGWLPSINVPIKDRDLSDICRSSSQGGNPALCVAVGARHFGSAHPMGILVVLCDDSVRTVRYNVSPEVFRKFLNRNDGEPFSSGDL
jgi:hypothetical protein